MICMCAHMHIHTNTHTQVPKQVDCNMCRFSRLLLFSFFFCKDGSDRLMKRASFSCCSFICVVLAAAYLKYRRCRLSCLPFVWHLFFHCDTHTHTHTHRKKERGSLWKAGWEGKQINTRETAVRIVLVYDIFRAMTRQVQYMTIQCTPKMKELNLCTNT